MIRGALWSEPGSVTLHVTREPSCSSIHKPDERVLAGFIDVPRLPALNVDQRVSVPSTTLDAALADAGAGDADFIKLDIHGAEYEALLGSRLALSQSAVGVLVECWPVAIHAGQHCICGAGRAAPGERICAVRHRPRKLAAQAASNGTTGTDPVPTASNSRSSTSSTPQGSRGRSSFPAPRIAVLIAFAELSGQSTYAMTDREDAAKHGVLTQSDSRRDRVRISTSSRVPVVAPRRGARGSASVIGSALSSSRSRVADAATSCTYQRPGGRGRR